MKRLLKYILIILIFFSPIYCLAQGKITHPQRTNTPSQQEQTHLGQSLPVTISGYTLGRMTRSGAEKYTFDKGYSLSYPDGSKLTSHYVDFAGYIWNDVELFFYQNKVYKIVFSKPDIPSEHKTFGPFTPDSEIFTSISRIISDKYSPIFTLFCLKLIGDCKMGKNFFTDFDKENIEQFIKETKIPKDNVSLIRLTDIQLDPQLKIPFE